MRYFLKLLFITFVLGSCGVTSYLPIGNGSDVKTGLTFNVKKIREGCCGCSGVLVNTFNKGLLESQLHYEAGQGCPFSSAKFYYRYLPGGQRSGIDTLIAVSDSTFQFPITTVDQLALNKVDSFIQTQTLNSYRLHKVPITGYRNFTSIDRAELKIFPGRLSEEALR